MPMRGKPLSIETASWRSASQFPCVFVQPFLSHLKGPGVLGTPPRLHGRQQHTKRQTKGNSGFARDACLWLSGDANEAVRGTKVGGAPPRAAAEGCRSIERSGGAAGAGAICDEYNDMF